MTCIIWMTCIICISKGMLLKITLLKYDQILCFLRFAHGTNRLQAMRAHGTLCTCELSLPLGKAKIPAKNPQSHSIIFVLSHTLFPILAHLQISSKQAIKMLNQATRKRIRGARGSKKGTKEWCSDPALASPGVKVAYCKVLPLTPWTSIQDPRTSAYPACPPSGSYYHVEYEHSAPLPPCKRIAHSA
jgi:hypothetical protein